MRQSVKTVRFVQEVTEALPSGAVTPTARATSKTQMLQEYGNSNALRHPSPSLRSPLKKRVPSQNFRIADMQITPLTIWTQQEVLKK